MISAEVWTRYENSGTVNRLDITALAALLGGDYANIGGFGGISVTQTTSDFTDALTLGNFFDDTDNSRPHAYLNYIVFDESLDPVSSGFVRVGTDAGYEPPFDPELEPVRLAFGDDIIIEEKGYIYIWVSNESENTKVWLRLPKLFSVGRFDDLTVTHTGVIVAQATDYGVWGDVIREEKANSLEEYRYGYQSGYSEKDEETSWNHFEFREYDPMIGRWTTLDAAKQLWSGYIGMSNYPIGFTDPNGLWTVDENGNLIAEAGDNVVTLSDYMGVDYDDAADIFNNLDNWNGGSGDAIADIEGNVLGISSFSSVLDGGLSQLGESAIAGPVNNQTIVNYFNYTSWQPGTDDENWCSAYANYVTFNSVGSGSGLANARSWLDWGTAVTQPRTGDIVVFWRVSPDSWQGHVGIVHGEGAPGGIAILNYLVGARRAGSGAVELHRTISLHQILPGQRDRESDGEPLPDLHQTLLQLPGRPGAGC